MSYLTTQAAKHLLDILADENNGEFDRVHEPDTLELIKAQAVHDHDELAGSIVPLVDQLYDAWSAFDGATHNDGRTGPDERDADEYHAVLDEIRGEAKAIIEKYFHVDPSEPQVCIEHTGGNCTAIKVAWGNRHLLITSSDDPSTPNADANAVCVGLYDKDSDAIGDAVTVGNSTVDLSSWDALAAYISKRSSEICKHNICSDDEHNCASFAYVSAIGDLLDICQPDYFQGSGKPHAAVALPFNGTGEELFKAVQEEVS